MFVFGVPLPFPPKRTTPMVALAFKKPAELPANDIEPNDIIAINGAPKIADRNEREDIALYLSQITGPI